MTVRREIVLGVTGGIAAYKAADLCSKLVQAGYGVTAVLTSAAEKFIGATTFEALTGRPVHRELFAPQEGFLQGEHIGLARRAELLVVAPASADFLAKLALGLADDLLSTIALVTTSPILVAPAMNCEMWAKPAVHRNVSQLRADGVVIIDPEVGWLSCRQQGAGRMAAPEKILAAIVQALSVCPVS